MRPLRDFRPTEIGLAALVALPIPFVAALALGLVSRGGDFLFERVAGVGLARRAQRGDVDAAGGFDL